MSKKSVRSFLATLLITLMAATHMAPALAGQDSSGSKSGQPRKRREPPPFDRPPLGQGTQSQPAAKNPPASRPSQPSGPARRDDSPAANDDTRGKGAPPVLRRPTDSRSPSSDDRDLPPITGGRDSEEPSGEGEDEVIRLNATLVNIPLLISDRNGRFIPRLTERDLLIYEDGVQQEVAFFSSEEVPFSVALLLDMSPSTAASQEDIQDTAIEFVRQLRPQDRVMVVSFDRNVQYLTDFTNNRRELEDAIQRARSGSGTSVYDAVFQTVRQRMARIEGRKALILFSDGEDTTSRRADYEDAVDAVTESDVLVYGLRYPSSSGSVQTWPRRGRVPDIVLPFPFPFPRRRRGGNFTDSNTVYRMNSSAASAAQRWPGQGGRDFMDDITTAGGGPVYDARQVSDMKTLAARIAEELRHVYVVSYYPTNPLSNGGYRQLRVRVRSRDDLAVRHRRGYNADTYARGPSGT